MDNRIPLYTDETIQLEYAEDWSSDGDSVSTDSLSSDSPVSDDEQQLLKNTLATSDETVGVKYLRRAGILTREEVVDQAIDRWSSYVRLCGRALTMLRENMVDNYVKQAVEERFATETALKNPTTTLQQSGPINSRRAREARALKRFGRYSSKVENQRRIAAMSKFAIMSTRLAPWQKTGVSQQCKYRDPTTTTWERRCIRHCIPRLPFCSVHLVQSEATGASSLESEGKEVGGSGKAQNFNESGKPTKPMRKYSSARHRITSVESSSGTFSVGNSSGGKTGDTQPPPQYLFRKCGAIGSTGECMEPVITWSASTRCPRHTRFDTIWSENDSEERVTTLPTIDDKDNKNDVWPLSSSAKHAALVEFIKERRRKKKGKA